MGSGLATDQYRLRDGERGGGTVRTCGRRSFKPGRAERSGYLGRARRPRHSFTAERSGELGCAERSGDVIRARRPRHSPSIYGGGQSFGCAGCIRSRSRFQSIDPGGEPGSGRGSSSQRAHRPGRGYRRSAQLNPYGLDICTGCDSRAAGGTRSIRAVKHHVTACGGVVCPVHPGRGSPDRPPRRRRRPGGRGDASRATARRVACDRSTAASGGSGAGCGSAATASFAGRFPSGRKPSNPAALVIGRYRSTTAVSIETCCDATL